MIETLPVGELSQMLASDIVDPRLPLVAKLPLAPAMLMATSLPST